MSTIWAFLNNPQKLRTALLWYWLLSPLVFLLYAFTISANTGTEFRELLNDPTLAIAFLTACMTILMVGLLKGAEAENEQTEKIFGCFASVQQLLVGNLPGFVLAYFYTRSLWLAPREGFAPRLKAVIIAGMVLIGVLSALILLITVNRFLL